MAGVGMGVVGVVWSECVEGLWQGLVVGSWVGRRFI